MSLSIVRYEDPRWRDSSKVITPDLERLVETYFRPPGGCLLLAYDPESQPPVLGMAGFARISETICEARNIVVDWNAQGKGIGRTMMEALFQEARQRGYAGMRAEAPENIPALIGFFEHEGFTRAPAEFQRPGFIRFERML
jgi:GNAT superfamily N-acetyltransferase